MERADLARSARKRNIDVSERVRLFLRAKFLRARFKRSGDSGANFIKQFPNDRLFFFAQRFHLLAPRGNAAATAEIADTHSLERLLGGRGIDFAQRAVAQLFE